MIGPAASAERKDSVALYNLVQALQQLNLLIDE